MLMLTAGAPLRNSCRVNGAGITMAVSVTSGGSSGSGIETNFAFLALTNSCGPSVFRRTYYMAEEVRAISNAILVIRLILQFRWSQPD